MQVTYIDRAYAAAFVEADGCIQLTGVRVTNRNTDVLHWFEETFGGQVRSKVVPEGCWEWNIHAKAAVGFLTEVYPYFKFKGPQADLFFEYRGTIKRRGIPIAPETKKHRELLTEKLSKEKAKWRSH